MTGRPRAREDLRGFGLALGVCRGAAQAIGPLDPERRRGDGEPFRVMGRPAAQQECLALLVARARELGSAWWALLGASPWCPRRGERTTLGGSHMTSDRPRRHRWSFAGPTGARISGRRACGRPRRTTVRARRARGAKRRPPHCPGAAPKASAELERSSPARERVVRPSPRSREADAARDAAAEAEDRRPDAAGAPGRIAVAPGRAAVIPRSSRVPSPGRARPPARTMRSRSAPAPSGARGGGRSRRGIERRIEGEPEADLGTQRHGAAAGLLHASEGDRRARFQGRAVEAMPAGASRLADVERAGVAVVASGGVPALGRGERERGSWPSRSARRGRSRPRDRAASCPSRR